MAAKDTLSIAKLIVESHDGQVFYNMKETAAIFGVHQNNIGEILNNYGILVKPSGKDGKGKTVSAYDIADAMCRDRVSPLRGRKGA